MRKQCLLKKLIIACVLAISLQSVNGADADKRVASPWALVPGLSLPKLMRSEQLKGILGTDAITWPDGRSALIIYVGMGVNFYRCVDFFDVSFRGTGHACYKLKR